MFGKIREENEKEIATLKSIKQSLEARLLSAYDSDDGVADIAVPDPRGERINQGGLSNANLRVLLCIYVPSCFSIIFRY